MTQAQNIEQAAHLLKQGEVVAFPTETVYGLGAVINNEEALKKIFSTKERPFFDPLIVHVASIDEAKKCFNNWNHVAQALAEKFWPGPLTLVMAKSTLISDVITSGLPSVGVRMPNHKLALELIKEVGVPLAAPSANKFGKTSPTKASHVRKELGDTVFVLDDTENEKMNHQNYVGIESTVLMVKEINKEVYQLAILRKGGVVKTQIETVLETYSLESKVQWLEQIDKKESPGHMKHHYMPEIPFVVCRNPSLKLSQLADLVNKRLNELPDVIEEVKIIKPKSKIEKIEFLRLSQDANQAARELYAQLRLASERKPDLLCYIQMPQNNSEMWESVYDRLYKAASLIID
ncbi:MAG: L-threonylcarbamoyladenylate synthase [Pseudobdellovibrio sp.]